MKNIIYISTIAPVAARCIAGYIEVPQRTFEDYIFTAPILTTNIQGKVIDPSLPYGTIRSEDVDWIHEALAERQSLLAGDFVRRIPGTGARVKGENSWINPIGWVDNTEAWLDPSASLLSGVRLAQWEYVPDFTNVVTRSTFTNAVSNAFAVVTMPMTIGTVSVWTNKWSADILLPCIETVTNVHAWTPLDLCHGVDGVPFPMYTNTPRIAYGTLDRAFRKIPSARSISNAYAVLRGTKRLADAYTFPTNRGISLSEEASKYSSYVATTNYGIGGVYYQLSSACDTNGYWHGKSLRTEPFYADIPTRFTSGLVTTGGVRRVDATALYAYGYAYFLRRKNSVEQLWVATNYVARIASPILNLEGSQAVVRAYIDPKGICASVSAIAGMPTPPVTGVEYVPDDGEELYWDVYVDRFLIIYSITPSVKLPSW